MRRTVFTLIARMKQHHHPDLFGLLACTAAVGTLFLFACGPSVPPAAADPGQPPKAAKAFPLAEKQRQVCAAYLENEKQVTDFNAKVTAAGNPIAQRAIEKNRPDFLKMRTAKVATIMGDGSFQDWIGYPNLRVEGDRAFITLTFPCPGFYVPGNDSLSFGNEWRNGFAPKPPSLGIPVDSPLGQSLGKLTLNPGDLVSASGKLFCKAGVECRTWADAAMPDEYMAEFTAVRSFKAGH
jgi:hypothetical protein